MALVLLAGYLFTAVSASSQKTMEYLLCPDGSLGSRTFKRRNERAQSVPRYESAAGRMAQTGRERAYCSANQGLAGAGRGGADSIIAGIQYNGWHTLATQTLANLTANGSLALDVEKVVRSEGNLSLFDIYDKYGPQVESNAMRLYWEMEPLPTYYCIYQAPAGEPGLVPDCKGVNETLSRHAGSILAAGFNYIAFAATNLPTQSVQSQLIQQRPAAVILEHWSAMRASGDSTPDFAVWNVIDARATVWQDFLDLYNDPRYDSLILRDPASGKKVFIAPQNAKYPPDPAIVAKIEDNAGRKDVIVQTMWANLKQDDYDNGTWSFMSPCRAGVPHPSTNTTWADLRGLISSEVTDDDIVPAPDHPTGVVGGVGLSPCYQGHTRNAKLGDGTAVSVNPSFQLGYSSLPFMAAGKLDGLTLKRQFATAIRSHAHFLFMSSWNEMCAQPESNHWHEAPLNSSYSYSQGLHFTDDPDRFKLFVDTFGSGIGRDIEPSTSYGTLYTDIVASCIRVMRLQRALGQPLHGKSIDDDGNELPCDVKGEICCEFNRSMESWMPVWSLKLASSPASEAGDRILVSNATVVGQLLTEGTYVETCAWSTAPQTFCSDVSLVTTQEAVQGPFQLRECVADQPPSRVPLYQCTASGAEDGVTGADTIGHVLGIDVTCGGYGTDGVLVGCMNANKTSIAARGLKRCQLGNYSFSFVLDGYCDDIDGSLGPGDLLGYVHQSACGPLALL